jgi:ParB-like nuclease domain
MRHKLTRKLQTSKRLNRPFRAPAKAAPVLRVKLADLHYTPLLEGKPTMSSVIEKLRGLVKTAKGSTRADAVERLAEREPEWTAFVADVKLRGVQDPLVIEPRKAGGYWLKDGRNRSAAAIEAGLKDAPARISTESPEAIIVGSLAARRHVSKQLLAYVALDCYPHLVREKEGRPAKTLNDSGFTTLADLATHIGVHEDTLSMAARVHRMFKLDAELREKWEWRLYAGEGFQGLLAGTAAEANANNGKPTEPVSLRLGRFFNSFASRLNREWETTAKDTAEDLALLKNTLRRAIATLPDGAFEIIAEAAKHRAQILKHLAAENEAE